MIIDTVVSLGLKVAHAALTFATIQALVEHWGLKDYGTWVTFTSVATYITMFDLGVGYGIRNKVAEAWEQGNIEAVRKIVHVGLALYAGAALIGLAAASIITFTAAPFKDHPVAALILWSSCALSFLLSLYSVVLQALGRFKIIAALSIVTPLAWYLFVRGWNRTDSLSLEMAAAFYSAAMLLQALLLAWASIRVHKVHLFTRLKIDFSQAGHLIKVGFRFFLLQVTSLALTNSGALLVYSNLGASETAQYDAANKVFSMFIFGFSVLVGIAWTDISKAKSRADHDRLDKVFKGLHAAAVALTGLGLLFALFAEPLIQKITGVSVNTTQALPFAAMVGIQMLAYSSAVFLNAFEQLRVQIIAALVGIPLYFATALVLLRTSSSINAIPTATAAAALPALFMCFITVRMLLAQERARSSAALMPQAASV